jgi:hypothetical protein
LLFERDVAEALPRASAPSLWWAVRFDDEWVSAVATRLPATILQLDGADHDWNFPAMP